MGASVEVLEFVQDLAVGGDDLGTNAVGGKNREVIICHGLLFGWKTLVRQ